MITASSNTCYKDSIFKGNAKLFMLNSPCYAIFGIITECMLSIYFARGNI